MTTTINASTSAGLISSADTSGILQLQTANTAALTIDASQNVGVGTTTMTRNFNIGGSNAGVGLNLNNTGTSGRSFTINSTNSLASVVGVLGFYDDTASAYRMVIDSNGNLGVGTTSPSAKIDASSTASRILNLNSTSANGYGMAFNNSGTDVAYIGSAKWNFGGALNDMSITTHGAYNLCFGTNDTERARIDSSGNFLVGTTSSVGSERLNVTQSSGNHNARIINSGSSGNIYGPLFNFSAQAPNNSVSLFLVCSDNAATRAQIYSNGGIANFSANNVNLSDRREKTNFAPATSYLDKICAIPVQTFNYIDQNMEDDGGLTLGVVAQDVQTVAPELVMESNWGTEEEPKMRLSIYQTDLQYALMKCIQEQQAIIQQLQADVAALKGTV